MQLNQLRPLLRRRRRRVAIPPRLPVRLYHRPIRDSAVAIGVAEVAPLP